RCMRHPQGNPGAIDAELPSKPLVKVDAGAERSAEWLTSPLGDAALRYRNAKKRPSEYTAAMRDGVAHPYAKLERGLRKTKDPPKAAHLRETCVPSCTMRFERHCLPCAINGAAAAS